MEIKEENKLCDIMWQFDLHNKQTNKKKKKYIPPSVPSEQNTYLGGNIINLINSFCYFFSSNAHLSDYAMGDDVTFQWKHKEIKT